MFGWGVASKELTISKMKRTNLILMLLTLCVSLFAQPVTLTFTGKDAKNQHVQLNRVVITNLTQNWQETIYYPDTILMMGSTGIGEVDHANGMKLSQNVPNPFDGTTDFALQLPEAGKVSLTVYDLNGKKITAYQGKLASGVHTFRVLLNTTQSYLLTARCGNETATIKMINNGNAGENSIRHLGEDRLNMMLKSGTKGATNKPFAFGDNMIYMGYATINGIECVSQTVEQRQLVSETIPLRFDATLILPPTVQTAAVSEITSHGAVCGGNVVDDGGSKVTTRGVCWSTQPNPVFSESHTADGSGTGSFVSTLTGLTYGTIYYVRAYAVNSIGVAYGETQSFMTVNVTPPVVTTATVSNITHNSATCGGTVVDMGATITDRGVCWGTMPNPTIGDGNFTNDGQGAGSFVSNMVNLTGSTLYYVRAYATTEDGTFYGEATSFTTAAVQLPMVITTDISNVKYNSARCGYSVVDMNTYVTARGVCWSTSHNPTIEDAHTNDGTLAGSYTSTMFVLRHKTTYYVRAYASNSDGTAYGEEKSFTTEVCPLPSVGISNTCVEDGIIHITSSCSMSDVNYPVTARGICWSTSPNPTLDNAYTTDGSGSGTFTSELKNIPANTDIYIRAYSTNDGGTKYSAETILNTHTNSRDGQSCASGSTVTDRDGNIYNTVQIGNQCWMKENLRTTKYADGTSISQGSDYSTTVGYWYYPNNSSSNKATYGLLYNWKAVMRNASSSSANPSGVQGICPTGWYVPSDAEWTQLTDYVRKQCQYQCENEISSFNIAKALASTTGWTTSSSACDVGNGQESNNVTGFSALPAGQYGSYDGDFGGCAYFWSATENGSSYTYIRYFLYYDAGVIESYSYKGDGFSVRCLRDNNFSGGGETAILPTVTTSDVTNITETSAICGGNVTSDGGVGVTARGVCWSTSHNPTIEDNKTIDGTGTDSFTSSLTGLSASVTYYVRAYATNSEGTAYGEEKEFITKDVIIAAWTFDTLQAIPNTPNVIPANYDLGAMPAKACIYLDGTNGSSKFVCGATYKTTQLNSFGGNVLNDPRETTNAGKALTLVNITSNGNHMIIKFSTKDYAKIKLSFATRGSAKGFNNHAWAYSIDGNNYTDIMVDNTANTTTTFLYREIDFSAIKVLEDQKSVYVRLTISGCTDASSNNRFDNIVVRGGAK